MFWINCQGFPGFTVRLLHVPLFCRENVDYKNDSSTNIYKYCMSAIYLSNANEGSKC